MNGIREYLMSVCCGGLLCAMVVMISGEKSASSKLVKLLTGIFLATVILKPSISLKLSDWQRAGTDLMEISQSVVAEGERLAKETISQKATLTAEKLVREEAEKLGCNLEITLLWEEEMPAEITLKGNASPYAKSVIADWITSNMGLPKEAQTWIG